MYAGESFSLAPLALDANREVVHGLPYSWDTTDPSIASVASNGCIKALKSGRCFVTASLGLHSAKVLVEVADGARPLLSDQQWNIEHAGDCDDPEQSPSETESDTKRWSPSGRRSPLAKGHITPSSPGEPPEVPNVGAAASPVNAGGHPRFAPDEISQASAADTDNNLGSYNFSFHIPILEFAGRGVGVGLGLQYNSRTWTQDTTGMVFDYDQGWPAPGFRLNYGRIIPNYNVPSGDGDFLLIEADGTRTRLADQGDHLNYTSADGRFIRYERAADLDKLTYPNGTVVFYVTNGAKLVPNSIRDSDGNSITISYINTCEDAQRVSPCSCTGTCVRPSRQAINYITDTLGRQIVFYYYPNGNLAEIRVPGYNGGSARTLVKFYYQTLTMAYNFGELNVLGVPPDLQIDVLRRAYFPDTGRGYVFDQYSGYGMCKHISVRLGMTDGSEGTEVAFTEYIYQINEPLSDSPQFTQRREWWQGKTDDLGNAVPPSSYAIYSYSRTVDSTTMTSTVTAPDNTQQVLISNNNLGSPDYGTLTSQKFIAGSRTLSQHDYVYSSSTSQGGLQRVRITTTDDGTTPNQARTEYVHGSYGRLMEVKEYGFRINGNFKLRRHTFYSYVDAPIYINRGLLTLANEVRVFDAKQNGDPSDDTMISRTQHEYDNPDSGWETETYGFIDSCSPSSSPPCTPPPGYDTAFINRTARGNVTKTRLWTDATSNTPSISFRHRYDIFGNEVKAELSCCSVRRFVFTAGIAGMHYSTPQSVTEGPEIGPNLTSNFSYDFNTGFPTSQTNPNQLQTTYQPDAALRVRTVTSPSGLTAETFFADAAYPGKDGLVYQSRVTYMDGSVQRVIVSNQWLDGDGRVLRAGVGTGATPPSFDAVKTIYDELGRVTRTTNPFTTTSSDGDTPGLPNNTHYEYDGLGRIVTATLPDGNTIINSYDGAAATVMDTVGRQKLSEVDGLGRLIRVTEMDTSKQLTWHTFYTYDLNDNLIGIDQGGQTRSFKYDSLSRLLFERTPEQSPTISDGVGGDWSARYTYTDFGAISTKEDARHVVTTYAYDGLNRVSGFSYNTTGTT
ncbi:MAG TPA: hypothetical protein VFV34_00060, partial [Blastocatellia bacterium]|nr:hypothetical protein [Blastocatellia bacterium]